MKKIILLLFASLALFSCKKERYPFKGFSDFCIGAPFDMKHISAFHAKDSTEFTISGLRLSNVTGYADSVIIRTKNKKIYFVSFTVNEPIHITQIDQQIALGTEPGITSSKYNFSSHYSLDGKTVIVKMTEDGRNSEPSGRTTYNYYDLDLYNEMTGKKERNKRRNKPVDCNTSNIIINRKTYKFPTSQSSSLSGK
jgi:hypothetical protein